jgi:GTP-binding protein
MIVSSATFVSSNPGLKQCPKDGLPEFAFIGRSNVGKSSLINMLTGRKGLAKTSGSPGKTRMINHFLVNGRWYLVDLPGYGYARISRGERIRLQHMIEEYLLGCRSLRMTFVLIDSRHDPQPIDLEFIAGLDRYRVPFTILFTKTDKLKKNEISRKVSSYLSTLEKSGLPFPPLVVTSSISRAGKEEILMVIERMIRDKA